MENFARIPDETERTAKQILDGAFAVHRALGPGLLESVYQTCLLHELRKRGVPYQAEVCLPIVYDGTEIAAGLRLDIWVQRSIVVEVKAVERMTPLFDAQLLTYLKMTRNRLGLLINFNVPLLKDGIKRIVL